MLVAGYWETDEDGIVRPMIDAKVAGRDESLVTDDFLVDPGADRTVFSAALLAELGLDTAPTVDSELSGIGGTKESVLVNTVLEFLRDNGGPARIRGEFATFTDPEATDFSILGRDVLDNFDVIISRRRNKILLLAPRHQYRIEQI